MVHDDEDEEDEEGVTVADIEGQGDGSGKRKRKQTTVAKTSKQQSSKVVSLKYTNARLDAVPPYDLDLDLDSSNADLHNHTQPPFPPSPTPVVMPDDRSFLSWETPRGLSLRAWDDRIGVPTSQQLVKASSALTLNDLPISGERGVVVLRV